MMRRLRTRSSLFTLLGGGVLLLMWQLARAQAPIPPADQPIQAQIQDVVGSLLTSEANNASGAHIPGVGVIFTMDLIRGPNTLSRNNPFDSTRDWATYLMQTFGAKMTELPDNEIIAMSVDFYDYSRTINHQLVITSRKSQIADPTTYTFYLNSKPYAEAVAQLMPGTSSPPAATAVTASETPVLETGPISLTLDFADGAARSEAWSNVGGVWQFTDGTYEQTETNLFDLISFFNVPLQGAVRIEAQMRYLAGNMGGGLIFNAPSNTGKNGAHIVSYTAGGTFLQYGYFDERGVFQYQGGVQEVNGADGEPHSMAVRIVGDVYEVSLDGIVVAQNVPLHRQGGYVGLFVSTSQVSFDNFKLESVQP